MTERSWGLATPPHRVEAQTMSPAPVDPGETVARLEQLGLASTEAQAYLSLLAGPKTPREVGDDIGVAHSRATTLLTALSRRGLINRVPGKVTRFAMSPPEWILPALIRQREQEVEQLHSLADELTQRYRASHEGGDSRSYVEIVVGIEAALAQFRELLASATREVIHFVKLPILSMRNPDAEVVGRGVAYRTLWDGEALEAPGMMDAASESVDAGLDVRAVPSLPSKLVIVDRKAAVISVTEDSHNAQMVAGLFTRHPEVVATLHRLSEMLWQTGVPLFRGRGAKRPTGQDAERERLIACLSAGMTETAIARNLGISRRTLTRRTHELLDSYGVRSRVQLGVQLARSEGGPERLQGDES